MVVVTAEPRRHPFPEPAPRPPTGYLDAVAGQPLLPAARQAWLAAAELAWSDPARLHHEGRRAGMVLDAARASVAGYLGVRPEEVFFTSSGPTAAPSPSRACWTPGAALPRASSSARSSRWR